MCVHFYKIINRKSFCICLRLSKGNSCIIHLQHCWRKIVELALRSWKKNTFWIFLSLTYVHIYKCSHAHTMVMRVPLKYLSSSSLQPGHSVSLAVEQQSFLQLRNQMHHCKHSRLVDSKCYFQLLFTRDHHSR